MTTEFHERLDKLEYLVRKTIDELDELRFEIEENRPKINSELSQSSENFGARYGRLDGFMRNQAPELQADQTYMVINMQNRLGRIDRRLRKEPSDNQIRKAEVRRLREAVDALVDPILNDENLLDALGGINREIIQIEEQLAA